jgi:RNA polymerase sigma-70 factor (ECF subfamily)
MSERERSSDEELWQAAIAGSADSWGDLFLRHQEAVYHYCFRRTADRGAAEDLTSAVFLEAWKLRSRVRLYGDSALPWLYGIATMLTRNHERTLRRYRGALRSLDPADAVAVPDPAAEIADRIDAQRQAEYLRSLVRQLPERDREVLELAALGTLSVAEIATALGVAPGTVKSRLSRARARLAELLAQNPASSGPRTAPAATPGRALPTPRIPAGSKRSGAL